jgi:3-isopropylmalate/(R)-2-methylmalate dehydratase small subunit
MDKFTQHRGVAAPMDMINIDTDMIIPKNFLKTIKRSGLGKHLFQEMRYSPDGGSEIARFRVEPSGLSRGANRCWSPGIISAAGSSREHAPWALLKDFRHSLCIIATELCRHFLQ